MQLQAAAAPEAIWVDGGTCSILAAHVQEISDGQTKLLVEGWLGASQNLATCDHFCVQGR
jgi:hypothetical protein